MELHFFPGQNLIVVRNKLKLITHRFEAMGGPPTTGKDPIMPEQPTTAGRYLIDSTHAYRTPTWALSSIKWGTRLKDKPAINDVWYELGAARSGIWGSILKDKGIDRKSIIEFNEALYGKDVTPKVPETWIFNDFGPIAIRYFKDINKNGVLDGSETLSGEMLHTTPANEAQHKQGLPVRLHPSHGCVHLKPADRDTLFAIGAFRRGSPFVVHKYTERFTGTIL